MGGGKSKQKQNRIDHIAAEEQEKLHEAQRRAAEEQRALEVRMRECQEQIDALEAFNQSSRQQHEAERAKLQAELDAARRKSEQLFNDHTPVAADLIAKVRSDLGIDIETQYNLAFVGLAGTGKSSLINAMRGVDDSSKGAARVSVVECTSIATRYWDPDSPHICFWDMPGAGTEREGLNGYFSKWHLYAYDCLLITTNDRITVADMELADMAAMYSIPVALVRNKIDTSLKARQYKNKGADMDSLKIQLREEIVEDFASQWQAALVQGKNLGKPPPLFLVSADKFRAALDTYTDDVYMDELKLITWLRTNGEVINSDETRP